MESNDIIKTLEGAILNAKGCDSKVWSIEIYKLENALDLINCLQAEEEELVGNNDKLKAEIERLRKEVNLVSIQFQDLQERYEEAQAEIERLNAGNMLTISERNAFRTSFYDVLKQLKIAKSEAVKKFTKTLKEFMHNKFKALDEYEFEYITERDLDNLLKEKTGEDNA